MSTFKEINIKDFNFNPYELKQKWMLVTAQKEGKVNSMTASWGGFGVMWNKEVAFIVVRPQRYTKEFIDATDSFSLTFFNDSYKKTLNYLGKVSGKDEDKMSKIELTTVFDENIPYFNESETTIFVKNMYAQPLAEEFFIDKDPIEKWYPQKDFHTLYIAEISKILVKQI